MIQDISHESMKQALSHGRHERSGHPAQTCVPEPPIENIQTSKYLHPQSCLHPRAVCIPELSTYEAIDKLIIQHSVNSGVFRFIILIFLLLLLLLLLPYIGYGLLLLRDI